MVRNQPRKKQGGIWDNDILRIGYKYEMTDVAAALGLDGLDDFPRMLKARQRLLAHFISELQEFGDATVISRPHPGSVHAAG